MPDRSPSTAKERVCANPEPHNPHEFMRGLRPFYCPGVAADRLPDPAGCRNPRCNEGWVERGDNESGGAPAFRCRTEGCPYAPISAAVPPAEPPERDETPAQKLVRGALWLAAIDTVPIENRIAKVDEWMENVDYFKLIERTLPDGR